MPDVAIIMGSDSDLPVMKTAAETLKNFAVSFEMRILSAHRTPKETADYVAKAPGRGVKVIIAGAGGAAHLPGVIAAFTVLPVIGIPVKGSLEGLDALLSIVQMPPGIPVASVGINSAKNAALLAVSVLALGDKKLTGRLASYRRGMKKDVLAKSARLAAIGYKKYLEAMKK